MNWHLALAVCGFIAFLLTLIVALFAGSPDYDTLDTPHHSTRRNGVEAVPTWIMKDVK